LEKNEDSNENLNEEMEWKKNKDLFDRKQKLDNHKCKNGLEKLED
jgi:hypothetical protein